MGWGVRGKREGSWAGRAAEAVREILLGMRAVWEVVRRRSAEEGMKS